VNPSRRRVLRVGGAALAAGALPGTGRTQAPGGDAPAAPNATLPPRYAAVRPDVPLVFPRDFGAHPTFRTEWWYVTGWLRDATQRIGFQLTFFRARTAHAEANPSRFAPRQLLVAHAALAIPGRGRLRHAQRAARAGFGLAEASAADTDVHIDNWSLRRGADDRYQARIPTPEFTLDLAFTPPGPPLPQGDGGYSRKGPLPEQASHYYSRPQLALAGSLRIAGNGADAPARAVDGVAWLDHEWSSELLAADAVGWDWIGLNFDDGSALMAFRIRRADNSTLFAHARWIGAAELRGAPAGPAPTTPEVLFEPLRSWRSPRSGATYPVAMRVRSGGRSLELQPLFDDQELDARMSVGTIYWEGAVTVLENGREVGRGYLELTGYAGRPPV